MKNWCYNWICEVYWNWISDRAWLQDRLPGCKEKL